MKATHIVGGDFAYRYLGNDSFAVRLALYVDCFYGSPGAIREDAQAILGVFDSLGNFLESQSVTRTGPVRINSVSLDCVLPPTDACVDEYVYEVNIFLPFRSGGYYLAFQRCCRNNSIVNIVDPLGSGATFYTYIPDSVFSGIPNNSAVFTTLPPNYLCAGRPFVYDHSATDLDGDSLAYRLYTPVLGGSSSQSRPNPPDGPPYQPVVWKGGFSEQQMMRGNPELNIDPRTGFISVTPVFPGQYVVGIAVDEFRNGKLLSTTRRDFQFNVFDCVLKIVSAFSQDIRACSDTIRFDNLSSGATAFAWDFGDSLSDADTSTLQHPEYIFPRTGSYRLTLIASDGNCRDTARSNVFIDRDIGSFASPDAQICFGDTIRIGTNDSVGFTYQWLPLFYLDNSRIPNPLAKPQQDIAYVVTRTSELCINRDTVKLSIKQLDPSFASYFQPGCRDATIETTPGTSYPYQRWRIDGKEVTTEELAAIRFPYNQSFRFSHVVSDGQCIDSAYQILRPLFYDSVAVVPNVFTPNGDGVNDCFKVKYAQLEKDCSRLKVYNRWGEIVFDSDVDGSCWNGIASGVPLSEGVYFYILDHLKKSFHGTIHLLR